MLLIALQGCVSFGRASYETWSFGVETFTPNPASVVPYWIGFILLGIAGSPLDLLSWPLTAIFFPGEKGEPSREFFLFSAVGPTIFFGTAGGTLLGALFYPFGLPFMSDRKGWNDVPAPRDEEPLPPPPGGDAPPPRRG